MVLAIGSLSQSQRNDTDNHQSDGRNQNMVIDQAVHAEASQARCSLGKVAASTGAADAGSRAARPHEAAMQAKGDHRHEAGRQAGRQAAQRPQPLETGTRQAGRQAGRQA